MKNKLFILLYIIISQTFAFSQFTINGYNKGWLPVKSNNGEVFSNIVSLQLEILGKKAFDYKNWSVTGRVVSAINNSEGKQFPVNKLKFRFKNQNFTVYFSENNSTINPDINQIGIIQTVIPMDIGSKYFIQNSSLSLNNQNDKYSILLDYDILIEGGNYLSALKSWKNYNINFEFSLLDSTGKLIDKTIFPIDMQIQPDGNYQEIPEVSIQINNNAQNAELVFVSANDYINGVTKTYDNSLTINANTGYEVTVKALSDKLKSTNSVMDINLVKVQLKNAKTNTIFNPETLSITPKRIASGPASTQAIYSITYSIQPSSSIYSTKTGNYSTPLIYSVSPL